MLICMTPRSLGRNQMRKSYHESLTARDKYKLGNLNLAYHSSLVGGGPVRKWLKVGELGKEGPGRKDS